MAVLRGSEGKRLMREILGILVFGMMVLSPCFGESVIPLGENPETHLREIRVLLPGLPENAKPLDMAQIPAGTFVMGTGEDDSAGSESERPAHSVTLTKSFYLAKCEITQAQWEAVTGSNPAKYWGTGMDYPVYYISWDDCREFIAKMNALDLGTFRLPTEAEWEYACQAGTETLFFWGDGQEPGDASRYAWYSFNSLEQTHPVGLTHPNPFGLYDMSGNVAEWCHDGYAPYSGEPQFNPQGPETATYRIIRGGYWNANILDCRSAARLVNKPNYRGSFIGIRLVREDESASGVAEWSLYDK